MAKLTRRKSGGESAVKGSDAETLKKLAPVALEINAHLASATKSEGKADDSRLSAALLAADCKAKVAPLRISFKKWCEDNLEHSFETVKKLAQVGEAKNPELALQDLRAYTAAANRKLRAKSKASPAARAESSEDAAAPSRGAQGRVVAVVSPYQRALDAAVVLSLDQQVALAESLLQAHNYRVVKRERVRGELGLLSEAQGAYTALLGGDRDMFGAWLKKQSAVKKQPVKQDGDGLGIPEFLDRRPAKTKKRKVK